MRITVEPYKGSAVPPQCARCQQFYHVAANCQAPQAGAHSVEEHCSWQCDSSFETSFVPPCALWKMGDHGTKYRGCPYFRTLTANETRNRPLSPTINTKQLNQNPPNTDRRKTSFQSSNQHRPPFKNVHDYPLP
jgi:hypothetical protein